jgi:hypothetical protein
MKAGHVGSIPTDNLGETMKEKNEWSLLICCHGEVESNCFSCKEIKTLKAKLKKASDTFIAISEYWNGSGNSMALIDALEAMRNMADEAAKAMEER